jgi:hypothetical protein
MSFLQWTMLGLCVMAVVAVALAFGWVLGGLLADEDKR